MNKNSLSEIINLIKQHDLSADEFFAYLMIVSRNTTLWTKVNDIVNKHQIDEKVIKSLEKKGLCRVVNNIYDIWNCFIREDVENLLEKAEEFWNTFPSYLHLGDTYFVSRVYPGGKERFIEDYIEILKYEDHTEIMKGLKTYLVLNQKRKINSVKLVDFIKNRMWEIRPQDEQPASFEEVI